MKKIILSIAIIAIASMSFSQTSDSWRIGIHLSTISNPSHYLGGSGNANALFKQNDFSSCALNFTWRYFCDEHWSFQSGLTFGELGFSFSMAKNYSLMKKESQYAVNNAGIGLAQIPLALFYDFKPNCNNWRFYIGAGISLLSVSNPSAKTVSTALSSETTASSSALSLDQTVNKGNSTSLTGEFMFGVEKVMKKGGMIQIGLVFNKGTKDIAGTTVNYTINNELYTHNFTNRGDFCGITLGYYFREHQKK